MSQVFDIRQLFQTIAPSLLMPKTQPIVKTIVERGGHQTEAVTTTGFEPLDKKLSTMTKQQAVIEMAKCRADPIYFIKTYVFIKIKKGGFVKFDTYDYQDRVIEAFLENDRVIILKSRQLGISTLYCAYVLWRALFFSGQEILIVANKSTTATLMIEMINAMLKKLPVWMVPDAKMPEENKQSMRLWNYSHIRAITTTTDSGVGSAISLLIIDEAAIIPATKAPELWKSIYPTVEGGGDVIILSTPRDVGHWYYEMWVGAVSGDNGFTPIMLGWEVHPDRDEAWARKKIKENKGKKEFFAREYACKFTGEGEQLIQYDDLKKSRAKNMKDPIRTEKCLLEVTTDKNIWIWEDPEPGRRYLLTADVSKGTSEDSSAIDVFKLPEYENYDKEPIIQVAQFNGKLKVDLFAEVCYDLGTRYNTAFIAAEQNSYGDHVNIELQKMEYENLYYDIPYKSKININQHDNTQGLTPGFKTTGQSRDLGINVFEAFFRNDILKIHSARSYDQISTFVLNTKKQRYEAISGKHDDLVTTLWIASSIWYTLQVKDKHNAFFIDFMTRNIAYRKSQMDNQPAIIYRRYSNEQNPNPNALDYIKEHDLYWLLK